jgi:uncharacterized membrane protein
MPHMGRAILWTARIYSVLWIALALAAPILTALGWNVAGAHVYAFLRHGCSDISGHSLWVCNHPLGLCARHAGIYTGFAVATFIGPQLKQRRTSRLCSPEVALLGLVPVLLDGGLEMFGHWTPTNPTRVVTGVIAGAGLGLYLGSALSTWSAERHAARSLQVA